MIKILDFIFFSRGGERAKKSFFFFVGGCAAKTQQKEREREKKTIQTQTHTQGDVVEARVETTRHETPKPARRVRPREKRAVPRENRAVREQRQRGWREQNETKWSPNAKRKRLYSEVLDRMVSVQVTAHALRCIDKAGGLDNYVLNTSAEKMASLKGMELKDKMMRALLEVDAAEVNDEQPPPPPPKSD